MKIPMILGITIPLLLLIFIWGWVSSSLILKVSRLAQTTSPKNFGMKYEDIGFRTKDNIEIRGWFIYPKEKSGKTVIICHGWGADRSDIFRSTVFLLKKGFNLLYFDFRNHGESGGNISSLGRLESYDLTAALDFLKKQKPAESKKIGVYGISMGGAVVIITAAMDERIDAVTADSPFSNFNYIVRRYAKIYYKIGKYPLTPITFLFTMSRLGFNPEKSSAVYFVSKISPRPIFFIHGEADVRIPIKEGRKLYDLAGEPKEFWSVPEADHMESATKRPFEYEKRVSGFFTKYLK